MAISISSAIFKILVSSICKSDFLTFSRSASLVPFTTIDLNRVHDFTNYTVITRINFYLNVLSEDFVSLISIGSGFGFSGFRLMGTGFLSVESEFLRSLLDGLLS